jgi:hypothetical protein
VFRHALPLQFTLFSAIVKNINNRFSGKKQKEAAWPNTFFSTPSTELVIEHSDALKLGLLEGRARVQGCQIFLGT